MSKSGGSVKETEYEKELAKVYAEEWEYYQDSIVPYENMVIDDALEANDASVYEGIAADANLGSKKSFTGARDNTATNLAASGFNPNSGKFKGSLSDLSDKEAVLTSDTIARSEVAGQERYIDKMANIVAMGQGESQEATATLSDIAQNSQRKAFNDASISQQKSDNLVGAAGALTGAAASYYGSNSSNTKNAATTSDILDSLGEG